MIRQAVKIVNLFSRCFIYPAGGFPVVAFPALHLLLFNIQSALAGTDLFLETGTEVIRFD